ncbi:MAG: hypothetical protein AAFR58_03500 [Cyanobacteria bacterium J06627_28]
MSSPFSTLEEFNGALDGPTGGAIYTFADKPALNNIALIVSVGLFVWFIVKTYTSHAGSSAPESSIDASLNRLSSFIIIGLLSLVAADYRQQGRPDIVTKQVDATRMEGVRHSSRRVAPLGLFGMVSVGLPSLRASRKRKNRNKVKQQSRRSSHRYRP